MTAHWFPHLDGFWEKGGGCRSEASGGTAKHSSSLFRFGDDVCDKELEGCGDGGLGGLYKDAAPKDMAFLPLHADTLSRRGLQSWKNAFTRPSALSFPFVSWRKKKKKNHNNINTKRKKKVWLCSRSLSLAVDLEVGGRASRSTALISCPKPSVLANEKRERDHRIRFHCGRTTRSSWLRDSWYLELGRGPSNIMLFTAQPGIRSVQSDRLDSSCSSMKGSSDYFLSSSNLISRLVGSVLKEILDRDRRNAVQFPFTEFFMRVIFFFRLCFLT